MEEIRDPFDRAVEEVRVELQNALDNTTRGVKVEITQIDADKDSISVGYVAYIATSLVVLTKPPFPRRGNRPRIAYAVTRIHNDIRQALESFKVTEGKEEDDVSGE